MIIYQNLWVVQYVGIYNWNWQGEEGAPTTVYADI